MCLSVVMGSTINDLDSGNFDITSNLDAMKIIGFGAVSIGGETFAIEEDLKISGV